MQLLRWQLLRLPGERNAASGHRAERTAGRACMRASSARSERTSIEMECIALREGGTPSSCSCSSCCSRSWAWPSPVEGAAGALRFVAEPAPRRPGWSVTLGVAAPAAAKSIAFFADPGLAAAELDPRSPHPVCCAGVWAGAPAGVGAGLFEGRAFLGSTFSSWSPSS